MRGPAGLRLPERAASDRRGPPGRVARADCGGGFRGARLLPVRRRRGLLAEGRRIRRPGGARTGRRDAVHGDVSPADLRAGSSAGAQTRLWMSARHDGPGRAGGGEAVEHRVLLGLYDWRIDGFWTALHARYLQRTCWRSAVSISFPRLRHTPARFAVPHLVSDRELVRLILASRLFSPEAGINLSTRERPASSRCPGTPGGDPHEARALRRGPVAIPSPETRRWNSSRSRTAARRPKSAR